MDLLHSAKAALLEQRLELLLMIGRGVNKDGVRLETYQLLANVQACIAAADEAISALSSRRSKIRKV